MDKIVEVTPEIRPYICDEYSYISAHNIETIKLFFLHSFLSKSDLEELEKKNRIEKVNPLSLSLLPLSQSLAVSSLSAELCLLSGSL